MLLQDCQLEELVQTACSRIQIELDRHAPFLGEKVSDWMAQLSPTGKAPDYFLQPRMFPSLRLPLWASKSFSTEADDKFRADVVYSTVNGYYYIRLLDNLMDGHGTNELKILPATAFFHFEFQAPYQKYFEASHPFWQVFRSAWFSSSDAVAREMDMSCINQTQFDEVAVAKLAGFRIPLAAVAFRYGAGDRLRLWEEFSRALARWSQAEDDLFDWHSDLRHGKPSHFLTEARRRKGDEAVEAWIIREGFEQAFEALEGELSVVQSLAASLKSEEVMNYLEFRETLIAKQKAEIGEGFRILKHAAKILERNTTQMSHRQD